MALEIKGMTRSFRFKKGTEYITLLDPDPNISPDMVMGYYSNMYPELTTAPFTDRSSGRIWRNMSSRQLSERKDKGYGKG